uniref:Klotho beta n=1 Tax=Paramormyrops kingsleyae TaxID=1676925 RepID=A0A3B3STH9_9TELE|nr:beta-klotho [Paramormyrops kingsleyae]
MRRAPSAVCPAGLSLLMLLCCVGGARAAGEGRSVWQRPAGALSAFNASQLFLHATFPPDFLWGAGSSAFQTEGAWDRDGKGPSVWDSFTHAHARSPGETADVASDGYERWEDDVASLKSLGVRFYAFSISWARIFPNGIASEPPNAAGVAYYSRLIDRLREEGIAPVVTLYHWDLPLSLQERYGGWLNDSLVDVFDEYAAFCFLAYGDRVRYWITVHNPFLVAWHGYGSGLHAPGDARGPAAAFTAGHNLLRAHAKAWHTYDRRFRPQQRGMVSIALGSHWVEPYKGQDWQTNVDRCQESMEAVLGWFAEPIHGRGDYPASLKSRHRDLVPEFMEAERQLIKGTADFFALSFGPNNLRTVQNPVRFGQQVSPDLRRVLSWIHLEYHRPDVFIVENGWFSDAAVGTEDTVAIYSLKKFINQVLQAIVHDGVRVFGYTVWSLLDGFEWNYGYAMRRGLFHVDFLHQNRTRVPKTSAFFYSRVIADNGFPGGEETRDVQGRFSCDFQWGVSDSTLQVNFRPFSPQFTDPHLYSWNLTGDGALRPVLGVRLKTRGAQCTDFLAIQQHVRLLAATGVTHYRFSLNWSLVLPRGDLSVVDTEALRYYRCMLKELRARNIRPMVTLYYPTHNPPLLGLPAPLHDSGGWLNRSTVDTFRDYAELCFRELGAWVPLWITINEPNRLSQAYDAGDSYLVAHHLLLAHAAAWRLYDREFRGRHGARVSFSLHADWAEPANPFLESHRVAATRFLLFEMALFLDPLLLAQGEAGGGGADYPREVREYLQNKNRLGLSVGTLPRFSRAEETELRGALDFIAVSHFTTRLVSHYRANSSLQQLPDHDSQLFLDPTWASSPLGQALVPWGLRRVLCWFKRRYGDTSIIVTASGVDDRAFRDDQLRQYYLQSYLQEALKAYVVDAVNIQGFYVWNLQDRHGPRFGLFTSPEHQCSAKSSVAVYREIIARQGFPATQSREPCLQAAAQEDCAVCGKILENKALLFFAVCLFLTLTTLGLLVFNTMRRKRARPCSAPTNRQQNHWDRVAIHHMGDNFHDNCLKH